MRGTTGTHRTAAVEGQGLQPVVLSSDAWSAQLAPRSFAPPAW